MSTVDNSKNNHALGWVLVAVFIVLNVVGYTIHLLPSWPWIIVAAGLAGFFGYSNIKAVSNVNNWVGVVGFISLMAIIAIYIAPISRHAI